jgi:hypothetical protein
VNNVSFWRINNMQSVFRRQDSDPIMLSRCALFYVRSWFYISPDWMQTWLLH